MQTKLKTILLFLLPAFIIIGGQSAKADTYVVPCYVEAIIGEPFVLRTCNVTYQTDKPSYDKGEIGRLLYSVMNMEGYGEGANYGVTNSTFQFSNQNTPGVVDISHWPAGMYDYFLIGQNTALTMYRMNFDITMVNHGGGSNWIENFDAFFMVPSLIIGDPENDPPAAKVK